MKSLSLHQPHAIVMLGIPGSGKSFFAEKFAETFNAPYVNADAIISLAANNEAATELIRSQVEQLVKTNQTIILEVGGEARQERTEFSKYLRSKGYLPFFVWVQTDVDTSRLRSNKAGRDEEEFEYRLKRFSPPHESEKAVVISGKHTYASQARVVLKRLSAPRAGAPHPKPTARPRSQTISIQ